MLVLAAPATVSGHRRPPVVKDVHLGAELVDRLRYDHKHWEHIGGSGWEGQHLTMLLGGGGPPFLPKGCSNYRHVCAFWHVTTV